MVFTMSQTILIDNDDSSPYLFNYLTSYLKSNVIKLETTDEVIELLELIPSIPLVIARAEHFEDKTAQKIFKYLKSTGSKTELIVLGVDVELLGTTICLEQPINWHHLLQEASNILNNEAISDNEDFYPVSIHHFMGIGSSPCDIFIRIKKGEERFQFVKLLNAHEEIDQDRLARYAEQSLKELYVTLENVQYFMTFVANALMCKMEKDLTIDERILTTAQSYNFIRTILGESTFEKAHIDLSETSIQSMKDSVLASPQISRLIRFLFSNKVSNHYKHAHLRALMCHYVLSKQSWYRSEHLHVLSFTSFYMGMTFQNEAQLCHYNKTELANSALTESEKMEVLEQPRILLETLENHPGITEYIHAIIQQSQGSETGIGLADDPSEALHPLSKVYIVADNFVKILLNPDLPSTKKDILPLLSERLKNPSYQKIIQSLEQKFI